MSDHCSFCGQPQESVAKLFSNPSAAARVYPIPASAEKHPLLENPLASDLLAAIERWIRRESLEGDAAGEIADVRMMARRMMES